MKLFIKQIMSKINFGKLIICSSITLIRAVFLLIIAMLISCVSAYYEDDELLIEKYKLSINYGKTVGIFGGSYSILPESFPLKSRLKVFLNEDITDYGINGFGFSSLQGSIQDEVNNCEVKDLYILWASTNDFRNGRLCGNFYDFSYIDNYDVNKLVTQCGGINYCIKTLREKNPNCRIYFISTLQFFDKEFGYDIRKPNIIGEYINDYINAQKKCCEMNNVNFLDMFNLNLFNTDNYKKYYKDDDVHLNIKGYDIISNFILEFIAD